MKPANKPGSKKTCQETNRNFIIGNPMWNKIHCKTNRSLCRETLLFNITEDSIIFELESLTTTVKQWTLDKTGPHIYYQLAKFL